MYYNIMEMNVHVLRARDLNCYMESIMVKKTVKKTATKKAATKKSAVKKTVSKKVKNTKYVYSFGAGKAEGNGKMKELLGGKGANLAEMSGQL